MIAPAHVRSAGTSRRDRTCVARAPTAVVLTSRAVNRLLLLAISVVLCARAARADERPKFQVGIGLGASIEPDASADDPLPAFFFVGGFGDGLLGVDLRVFANGATTSQVNRTAGEVVLAVRPLSPWMTSERYDQRVLRTVAVTAGPAYERVARGRPSDERLGLVLGLHLDLPLVPAAVRRDLRARVGVRRLIATRATLGENTVEDSVLELYGMLALVF
jgi:hypothetical protein